MWNEILRETEHRPWPLPTRRYAMTMTWKNLLFAHWPVAPALLRSLVPASLELDTFEEQAWIGVVPFGMRRVGPRGLPKPQALADFLELNVRTYVTVNDKPGVFFFSLDAANPLAVMVARRWFHLPYFSARMQMTGRDGWVEYSSERTHRGFPAGVFNGRYRPAGAVYQSQPGNLDHWLTERYCLYAVDRRGVAHRGEIHHRPWPLQPAELECDVNTVADAHGLQLDLDPPMLHYVDSLDVVAWNPQTT